MFVKLSILHVFRSPDYVDDVGTIRSINEKKIFWPILFIMIAFTTSWKYADVRSIHKMNDQINKIICKGRYLR